MLGFAAGFRWVSTFGNGRKKLTELAPQNLTDNQPGQPANQCKTNTMAASTNLTHENFPAQFVLYMPSRSSSKDPYSGFILMNSELTTVLGTPGSTHRKLTPVSPSLAAVLEFEKNPFNDLSCFPHASRWLNFKGDGDAAVAHMACSARQWAIPVHFAGAPQLIHVIEISKVNKLFAKMLKRNVTFRLSAVVAAAAAAASAVALANAVVGSPSALSPASTSVIAHVPATPAPPKLLKKKKPLAAAAPAPAGDLCLHVARQLLELAQIKKEMCPVIAEEYIAGETAIMPCGHLFSKLAIQESFKKENNKCPACRQIGRPTYV